MSIKKIIISQKAPQNIAPYNALTEKYGVSIDFRPFFAIEALSSREFRAQRVDLLAYTAVVFSSRHVIDAYFQLCDELRVKVPETMKYFCTSEAVAMYLQKHIVYRKRKIFFGTATPESVVALITDRHAKEKFLITAVENSNNDALTSLFDKKGLDYNVAVFVKSVVQDIRDVKLDDYDMAVLYNPNDVQSLFENFPDFRQGGLKFVSFGKNVVKSMTDAGLKIEIQAPTPECPSVVMTLEQYLKQNN